MYLHVFSLILASLYLNGVTCKEARAAVQEQRAAEIIAELVTEHHDFFFRDVNSTMFLKIVDFLVVVPLEKPDAIQWFLYDICDPENQLALFNTIKENGFLRNIFSTVYRAFCAMLLPETSALQQQIEYIRDCDPSESWCSNLLRQQTKLENLMNFFDDIVDTGFCSQDVENIHRMWDYVLRFVYFWLENGELDSQMDEFFSKLTQIEPAQGQQMWSNCEHLTTVTKKMVDDAIEEASQFYPDAEEEYVGAIYSYSGITITSREELKQAYCSILEGLGSSGLGGVYTALLDEGIAWHAFQQLYDMFESTIKTWEWVVEHNKQYAPDTYALLEELLQLIRELGLIGLE